MDIRQYYKKIREIEAGIDEPFVFVTSLETPDGGRAGFVSEVSRELAARLVVEGRAVRATAKEIEAYLKKQQEVRRATERAELSKTIQVALIRDADQGPHDRKSTEK